MFDAHRFVADYHIDYALSGKNVSEGWVGINDIYASDSSYHMGINPVGYVYSWKSGWHPLRKVIADLLNISYHEADNIIGLYSTSSKIDRILKKRQFTIADGSLKKAHRNFLRSRGFNASYIAEKYDLRAEDSRLIIPVYFNREIVSYQERDVRYKFYKACPKDKAIINYKDILYNIDNCKNSYVVVVEGILDAWRLGDDAVCTFGTSWTKQQRNLLTNRFNHVIILYDNEREAQKKGEKLGADLSMSGTEVTIEKKLLKGVNDPAELSQEKADAYMESLEG